MLFRIHTLAGAVALFSAITLPAVAQITLDGTLGNEGSILRSGVDVRGGVADLVEGGATRGGNLFHSFLEFNVGDGQRVYFANPVGIESILSRVTGENPSDIFGALGVDGGANLFLLNPNGIVFGEGATFDIEGSFYGTTGDAISLGEDGVFSATEPGSSRLLRVNPSVLLGNYLTADSGDIESRGQLAVQGDLALAGNSLDLQGQVAAGGDLTLLGLDGVRIRDTTETPFVGFAGGDLLVQGNRQVDIVALSYPDSGLFSYGDMVLRSGAAVGGDAHYWSGGGFRVETLTENAGALESPVDPIIRATGDVVIGGYLGSSLHILAGGAVSIRDVVINGSDAGDLGIDFLQEIVTLSDGTVVEIDGGTFPTLDIRSGLSSEEIGIIPVSNISGRNASDVFVGFTPSTEVSGNTDITVGNIVIEELDGVVLLLSEGNIKITGEGALSGLMGLSGINAPNTNSGIGTSVYLDAQNDVTLTDSFIYTESYGIPNDIVINAGNTVFFKSGAGTPTGIFTGLLAGSEGRAGDVRINANTLRMLNGARINSLVLGEATTENDIKGGNIILNIDETAQFVGFNPFNFASGVSSGVSTQVEPSGTGEAGDVIVNARNLEVLNGAQLTASNVSQTSGQGGNVILNVTETALFSGAINFDNNNIPENFPEGFINRPSGASSEIGPGGRGSGGNIEITANNLSILDGAQVTTSTLGTSTSELPGFAGNIIFNVKESIRLDAMGAEDITSVSSRVRPGATGTAGNIEVVSTNLDVSNGAFFSTSTFGVGSAGDITLNISETARFFGFDSNDGSATGVFSQVERIDREGIVARGSAGNINVTTNNLELSGGARLSNSSNGIGDAGNTTLNVTDAIRINGFGPLENSGILSVVDSQGEGVGGDIRIGASDIEISDNAIVSAVNRGTLDAGDITFKISGQVLIDDASIETSSIRASGGLITIEAGNVQLRNDGDIEAFVVGGEGQGGNISIISDFVISLEDSDIFAFSLGGTGGKIDLSQTILFSENLNPSLGGLELEEILRLDGNERADIDASGAIEPGEVILNDASFIENSLNELSGEFVDTATLTAGSCIVSTGDDNTGSFIVTGGEGLPQQPGVAPQAVYPTDSIQSPTAAAIPNIQEAHGVYQLANGRLVLSHECDR